MALKVLRGVAALLAAGLVQFFGQQALAAGPLKYQFKGMDQVYYQISIKADYPDSVESKNGMIIYQIKSVDAPNGQICFGYKAILHDHSQTKTPSNRIPGPPPMPAPPSPWGVGEAAPEILISPQGTVLRSNRTEGDAQLPHMLGLAWQLVLPSLPAEKKARWTEERSLSIYHVKNKQKGWSPPAPWERKPEERVDRPAREVVTYSIGQTRGAEVTINREYELATDEKVGNSPLMRQSGRGKIVFDSASGLVKSLEMEYVIEASQEDITVRIPVTVNARIFTAQEVAKYKADVAERAAKAKVEQEKAQARKEREDAGKAAVENGTIRTEQPGGKGGRPFVRADEKLRPVLGIRFVPGDWMGRGCFKMIEPMYEKPAAGSKEGDNAIVCFAKPGYAVGGLVVSLPQEHRNFPTAIQVIFMRMDPANPNKLQARQYRSDWVGDFQESDPKVEIGGKGEVVLGIFGRQGSNVDAIGLILKDPKAADAPADEDEKSPAKSDGGALVLGQ